MITLNIDQDQPLTWVISNQRYDLDLIKSSCRSIFLHFPWGVYLEDPVETIIVELILYSKKSVEQNIVDINIVDSIIELILDLIL